MISLCAFCFEISRVISLCVLSVPSRLLAVFLLRFHVSRLLGFVSDVWVCCWRVFCSCFRLVIALCACFGPSSHVITSCMILVPSFLLGVCLLRVRASYSFASVGGSCASASALRLR